MKSVTSLLVAYYNEVVQKKLIGELNAWNGDNYMIISCSLQFRVHVAVL